MQVWPKLEQDIGGIEQSTNHLSAKLKVVETRLGEISQDEILQKTLEFPLNKIKETDLRVASNTFMIKEMQDRINQFDIRLGSLRIMGEVSQIQQFTHFEKQQAPKPPPETTPNEVIDRLKFVEKKVSWLENVLTDHAFSWRKSNTK